MREVVEGKKYKHFKNLMVKVLHIGYDADTTKKVVIYEEENDSKIWVRDYDEFNSEVDRIKYPDVEQKYRFEEVD